MGVPGLWDVLRPAGKTRSLTHLSVKDGFEANPDGKRAFRIGIDASIWFYHAAYGREGENPELRTLFFKCARLMTMPFLPLFVFDGPKRPEFKRGKRISGKNHWLVQGMQEIILAFGFEWRMAPGEAEAELAYLNRIGVIDAVLSDDVDTFLFGAKIIVRNPSVTLSGNRAHALKNAAGKDDGNHTVTYTSAEIASHPDIELTQGGLVLIGVLRGGDYSDGLHGCGVATAHGLARAGFGDSLLEAARTMSRDALEEFLVDWREELRAELRANRSGKLQRKSPSLAKAIDDSLPNVDVLLSYTNPVTTEAKGPGHKNTIVDWDKEPDLGKIAGLCEMYFEWGLKPIIIKRFRTVIWPPAVLRIIRRAALIKDRKAGVLAGRSDVLETPRKNGKERRAPPGTPSSMIAKHFSTMALSTPGRAAAGPAADSSDEDDEERLIVKIHSSRRHPSTDNVLEYRLEIAPAQLVRLCETGIRGLRTELPPSLSDSDDVDGEDDEEGSGGKKGANKAKKPPPDPESHLRMWLPACMVEMVEPEMVTKFESMQQLKADKKAGKAVGKAKAKEKGGALAAKKAKLPAVAVVREEEEESSDSEPDRPSMKPKTTKASATQNDSNSAGQTNVYKAAVDPGISKISDFFAAKKPTTTTMNKMTTKVGSSKGDKSAADAKVNDFFVAKKPVNSVANANKAASSTAKVADLFKNIPFDESTDDEVPQPLQPVRPSTVATTSSSLSLARTGTTSHLSATAPSRTSSILSFLDSQPPSKRPSQSNASETSPSKSRVLRPFPMDFDMLSEDDPPAASLAAYKDSFPTASERSSKSSIARPRSALSTTDSDGPFQSVSALQKSPRKSAKHTSPRTTPQKHRVAMRRTPRKEESEESSSDSECGRPPSPSPSKKRQPTMLLPLKKGASSSILIALRQEEEEGSEEADRTPSPSLRQQQKVRAPSLSKSVPRRPPVGRKAPPLPSDLSIISISSDSDTDLPPAKPNAARNMPLLTAKAKSSMTAQAARQARTMRDPPPRQFHNSDDIIDLT